MRTPDGRHMFRGWCVLSWEKRLEVRLTKLGHASTSEDIQWTLRERQRVDLSCMVTPSTPGP